MVITVLIYRNIKIIGTKYSFPTLKITFKKMYFGPERKKLRLKQFDYSSNGFYFVTICTKNRQNYFGEITNGEMILNEHGKIVENEILKTEKIRNEIKIDIFVIMPNHLHLIVVIEENVGNAGLRSLQGNDYTKNKLSNTIQRIKSSITNQIRQNLNDFTFSWQKSFFDVIIRNDEQLEKTRNYILENPLKRKFDKNNILN